MFEGIFLANHILEIIFILSWIIVFLAGAFFKMSGTLFESFAYIFFSLSIFALIGILGIFAGGYEISMVEYNNVYTWCVYCNSKGNAQVSNLTKKYMRDGKISNDEYENIHNLYEECVIGKDIKNKLPH